MSVSGFSSRSTCPSASLSPKHRIAAQVDRRRLLAGAAALLPVLVQRSADARPALLDLPACDTFKPTASGVSFCDITAGSGDSPLPGDLIVVDYTARAVKTGKVYDGSTKFKFTVGNGEVIPGWEVGILGGEGVPPIQPGGTRTLLIPPELAYGPAGDACLFGREETCRIPPGSDVQITFKYRGLGY